MGLFSKPEVKKQSPSPAPKLSNPKSSQPPASTATLIGPEAHIKGEIVSSENVHIEGKIDGKVKSAKQVVIGEKGQLQAEVEAQIVTIRGKLEGDCSASNKVEITGTGKVYGNISAPRIAVAEGAVFRGASNMTVEQAPAAPTTPDHRKPEPLKTEKPSDSKSTGSSPSSPSAKEPGKGHESTPH